MEPPPSIPLLLIGWSYPGLQSIISSSPSVPSVLFKVDGRLFALIILYILWSQRVPENSPSPGPPNCHCFSYLEIWQIVAVFSPSLWINQMNKASSRWVFQTEQLAEVARHNTHRVLSAFRAETEWTWQELVLIEDMTSALLSLFLCLRRRCSYCEFSAHRCEKCFRHWERKKLQHSSRQC